jgi:outer membrane protein assembly complex protein YaeT
MRLSFRRLFRWRSLLILALAGVFVLLLAVAFLHTPWVRSFVLKKVEAYVQDHYGILLSAKSLDYNLLTLWISLEDPSLSAEKPGLAPFFQARRVAARLPLSLILRKALELKELIIDRPSVRLISGRGGIRNIPSSPVVRASAPAKRLPSFILQKCTIRDGSFVYADPERGVKIDEPELEMDMRWIGGTSHSVRLATKGQALIETDGIRLPVRRFLLAGAFDRDKATVKELSIDIAQSRLSLSGEVQDLLAPRLHLNLRADLLGRDIQEILGLKEELSGRIEVRASFSGPLKEAEAEGKIGAAMAALGPWRDAGISASFRWQGRSLWVRAFQVSSPDGDLSGMAEFLETKDARENRVEIQWTSLNLSLVSETLHLPARIGSRSSGSARAQWNESRLASLRGEADLTLSPSPENLRDRPSASLSGWLKAEIQPLSAQPEGSSRLRLEGKIGVAGGAELDIGAKALLGPGYLNLSSLEMASSAGKIDLSGRFPLKARAGGPLDVSMKAEHIDLEKMGRGIGVSFPFRGVLAVDAHGSGTLRRPDFEFRVSAENLGFRKFELGRASLQGKTNEGGLGFQLSLSSLPLSADGEMALNRPYEVHGTISATGLTLNSLNDIFYPEKKTSVEGSLTGTIDFRTSLIQPAPNLRMDSSFEEVTFGLPGHLLTNQRPVKVAFDGKALTIEDMTLSGPGTDLRIEGSLPVEPASGGKLSARAGIDLGLLELVRSGMKAQGRLDLTSTMTGSLSSPDIDLSAEVKGGSVMVRPGAPSLENIELTLVVRSNQANLEKASFHWGKANASLSARFPLDLLFPSLGARASAFELHGDIANLDPADLASALSLPLPQKTKGAISLAFDLGGNSLDWSDLSGEIRFSALRFAAEGIVLAQTKPVRVLVDRGRVDIRSFDISGAETTLSLSGSVDLHTKKLSGVLLKARVELALLRSILTSGEISGQADLAVRASGDLNAPQLEGTLDIGNGQMRWPEWNLSLSGVKGEIALGKTRVLIRDLRGSLNQGNLSVNGTLDWKDLRLTGADIQVTGDNILTDYPRGFLAEWDLDLRLASDGRRQRLSGKASMIQGEYTQDVSLGSGLFRFLKGGSAPVYAERNPFLDNFSFDVDIVTANAFEVRNNIAEAQVRAALKLTGTPYNPGLGGSILILDGGKVTFSGNDYQIEQGQVNFLNPNRIEPDLNLRAVTKVSGYTIQLNVSGTPDNLSASLTSDPALPEPDIVSLLTVGVPLQGATSSATSTLKGQAMAYLEGAVAGQVGKSIARGLGLETVRLDASLVAPQESPEARITVGQHLSPDLELIFSQDLRTSNVRTVILNYTPLRKLNIQALNQNGNSYQFSVQNELRFGPSTPASGGRTEPGAQSQLKTGLVAFSGDLGFPEQTLQKKISLRKGRKFDFLAYGKSIRKLNDFYRRSGHLDLIMKADKVTKDGQVNIFFHIQAGPKVEFRTAGMHLSRSLRNELEKTWMEETFARMKLGDVEQKARAYLCSKRYYQAEVKARIEDKSKALRRVLIEIHKGNRFERPQLVFPGDISMAEHQLRRVLGSRDMCGDIFLSPENSSRRLRDFFRQNGYLQARVRRPVIEYGKDGKSVRVTFQIEEGPLFTIRSIEFDGNRFLDRKRLLEVSGFRPGDIFRPENFDRSRTNLEAAYEAEGFIDVYIDARIRLDSADAGVAIEYKITENFQAVIEDIQISGNRLTRDSFLRKILTFRPGDLVNYRKINESRKNLYDLGVFNTLTIDLVPQGDSPNPGGAVPLGPGRRPYEAKIDLVEAKPVDVIAGVQYDTETSVGAIVTVVHENLFGRAVALGGSTILNSREQEARAFIRGQYFLGKKVDTILSVFYDRRNEPDFRIEQYGTTLQQQHRFREKYLLSYDYTFERSRVFSPGAPPAGMNNIGRLSLSLAYDSRNDFLNPSRGRFISQSLEYGSQLLGSDVRYVRYFGQSFFYFRLTPFLLLASGLRIGLEGGFGQPLPPELRFLTGGSSTVRGYGYNEIGPKNPVTGNAIGGEALLVINQEMRFPLYKIMSGAVFLDLGNIYPRASGFDPFRLRSGAGFGLRFNLGALVGRFDWGFKLERRKGESPSHVYFSIGQAF